jgi:(S)-3,5-dihydroxyphenylglycine transaminase
MLLASQLHASLEDPLLDSINFLNEVIGKFPAAISFAPGAPNPAHFEDMDIGRYVNRYIQYLCHNGGLKLAQAQSTLYNYGPAGGLINDIVAAAFQQDHGIALPSKAFVITVGAQEAMLIVLRALFRTSNERLAVVNPCYLGILGAARLLNIEVIGINETDEGIDLDELDKACDTAQRCNRPIRALYVAPDYSNPTGSHLKLLYRGRLLELAERHDLLLLEDNAYAFTAPSGEEIPSLKALDKTKRVIFLGTFAKSCLPGARVGYVIADQLVFDKDQNPHQLAEDLIKIKSMTTMNTSPICQAIIGGMILEKGGSISAIEREKAWLYQNNLRLLLDALDRRLPRGKGQLDGVSWNHPTGGFFVRMRLPIPADMTLLKRSASDYGVLWTPMSPFFVSNDCKNELRLSCSYLSPECIEEGVYRLANFLHDINKRYLH